MNSLDMVWLRHQWDDLMQFYGLNSVQTEAVYNDLVARYEDDGRYYHNLKHIQNVLEIIESVRVIAADLEAIKLAAWFHDVIYDPAATDNEEQSVILFNKLAHNILPETVIQKVSKIIKATLHIDNPEDLDEAFMLDIDLSSIAGSWQRFTKDNSNLRREAKDQDCRDYCEKKISFFNMLLDKDRIYFTDFFHAAFEEKARHNMENYIRLQFLTGKCTC